MSTVKEMIQIAFEYEVRIQQLTVELQKATAKIESLEKQTLASKVTTKE